MGNSSTVEAPSVSRHRVLVWQALDGGIDGGGSGDVAAMSNQSAAPPAAPSKIGLVEPRVFPDNARVGRGKDRHAVEDYMIYASHAGVAHRDIAANLIATADSAAAASAICTAAEAAGLQVSCFCPPGRQCPARAV